MKRILLAMILILPLILGGCVSDEQADESELPLVGSWVAVISDYETFYLDLKKDGTGKFTGVYDGEVEDVLRLTWSTSGTSLHIKYENGNSDTKPYRVEASRLYWGDVTYVRK